CTSNKTKRKITLKRKKADNTLLWSSASCDVLNDEIDDSDEHPNYSAHHTENITHETPTQTIAEEINISNSCPLTSLNVKKCLAFDIPECNSSVSPRVFNGVKKLKNTDYLQKTNRTICNIKYYLNMMSDKINNIEGMLLNDFKSGSQSSVLCEDTEFNNLLPLETEENLQIFENNLSNNEFRSKMFDVIDVENPLSIFIAGAKFRDFTRKNPNSETSLSDNNVSADI
ncbi:kinesin-related protein 2-like, partial [Aphis craccivora]